MLHSRSLLLRSQFAAYRWDNRLGLCASRLLHLLACDGEGLGRPCVVPPDALVSSVLGPSSSSCCAATTQLVALPLLQVRELAACGPAVAGDILARMSWCLSCADDEGGSEEADERAAVDGVRVLSRMRALASAAGAPLLSAAAALSTAPSSTFSARAARAKIRSASGLSRDVALSGVPLPLTPGDAPSTLPAATALAGSAVQAAAATPAPTLSRYPALEVCGWASDIDTLARTDARAAEARRKTLLSLLLDCLLQAEQPSAEAGMTVAPPAAALTWQSAADRGNSDFAGPAGAAAPLSSAGTVGHWLLGLRRSNQAAAALAHPEEMAGGAYAIPRPSDASCLHTIVAFLGVDGIVERRPSIAQQAAAVVHALLSSTSTRRSTLAFLQVRRACAPRLAAPP